MIIDDILEMQDIKTFIFDKKGRLNSKRFSKFKEKFPEAYHEIYDYTRDFIFKEDTFRYRFLAWFHQYTKEDLICRREECNNPVNWTHSKPNSLCSNKCRTLDGKTIATNLIKSNLKKYGVKSTAQLQETKKKFKQTMQKKYGVEYAMQNPILKERFNKSMISKYGINWPSQSKEIVNKKRKKSFKLYGVPHPSARPESISKLKITKKKNFYQKYNNFATGALHYNQEVVKNITKEFLEKEFLNHDQSINLTKMMQTLNCSVASCFNIFKAHNAEYIYNKHGFDLDKPAILYYIYDPYEDLYKIGITNKTIEERFGKEFCSNRAIAILEQKYFDSGEDAYLEEQEILNTFDYVRCENPSWPERKGGRTEFFKKDILNKHKKDTNDNR